MTDITFAEANVPQVQRAGRKAEPNPYDGLVDVLSQHVRTKDDAGKALTFEAPKHDKGDDAAVAAAVRKIRKSAERYGITVREVHEGRKVTVWAVAKITRKAAESAAS